MGYILSKVVLFLYVVAGLILVCVIPLARGLGLDENSLRQLHFIVPGIYLLGLGILIILFREDVGYWNCLYRTWIAKKFPFWAALSGISYDELETTYLSLDYSRKMVFITAVVLIAIGVLFIALTPGIT